VLIAVATQEECKYANLCSLQDDRKKEVQVSDRISIIVTAGTREKLQMAAMVASVGAVSGSEVTVFLSMNALAFFRKGASQDAPCEGEFGRLLETKKAPAFKMLFASAVELGGAKLHPCSMAVDVLAVKQNELETYVAEPLGLTKFLDDARSGQVYTF
jgi:peroxiredoxin family protein